jgi:A/G-specific adenine glycosylase
VNDRYEQFRADLLDWSSGNLRDFPWRTTTDPYEVLLAEVLLQRTPAERVAPIYEEVVETYPDLQALAEADVAQLAELLQPLGLQNQRARALVEVGDRLADRGVPDDEETLLDLPYVGKYAANATLCFAFGERRPIVDANVVRVYGRAFDREFEATDDEAWDFAETLLPERGVQQYNLSLLDFAASVCKSGNPACSTCFFIEKCDFTE